MSDNSKNDYKITYLPPLPKGWVWVRLGEVIQFVKGKKPKNLGDKNEFFKIPYINIEAFELKRFTQFTDGKDVPTCEPDDILIVWDGARCGLVGRGVKGVIGSTLAKLDCGEIYKSFLFYFLQTKYEYINKHPRGVGIPHVEPNLFWNIHLPLPPLAEQQRIVAKIEELFTKLNAGVEALKKAKEQIKRYRQAVLKYAFEGKLTEEWRKENKPKETAKELLEKIKAERKKKLGTCLLTGRKKYKELPPVDNSELPELPEGWVWVRVGEIYDIIGGGTPSTKVDKYWKGDIPWITSADIHGLKNMKPRKFITQEAILNSATNLVPENSLIVVTRVGLGKIAITKIPLCFSQDSQALIDRTHLIYPEYSLYCLSQIIQIFKYKNRGTTISGVTKKQLSELEFPLPPLPEQHKIVEEIERRFSVADEVEKVIDNSLKQAERLRQSILKKAFEGKLVPQDPNDEPAEKLLERIRKEKLDFKNKKTKGR